MITERISKMQEIHKERGRVPAIRPHFNRDYHGSALGQFKDLPHWEKLARAMAYAIENQPIYAYDGDRIGGRIYYDRELPIEAECPELDFRKEARERFAKEFPDANDMIECQIIGTNAPGHICWFYDRILRYGVEGYRKKFEDALAYAKDEKASEFYQGVIIMLDALLAFNDKHIEEYEKIGNTELADLMRKVPRKPCESFREAVQAYFMQHIVVMRENPFGGNGPGRLDYHLWPYLAHDLESGKETLESAKELIDELFLRIDERIFNKDTWVETIVVGGTHPNGSSAVNPLTYIMINSMMDLNITHPAVYVRLPEDAPEELVSLAAKYMKSGNNRAQILSDKTVIDALVKSGVEYRDAVEYDCGGCMEIGIQGMSSDFLWVGWQNTPKMLELMITDGVCLVTGKQYSFYRFGGLVNYGNFDDFYRDFIKESARITEIYLKEQEIYSELAERNRPSYLLSSMLDDCLARGRNMHGGGAKYHDYGASQLGMPNVADGLFAIKRAVFEDKICTAEELVSAMKANFVGYEVLQAKLKNIPKYGMDNDEADALASKLMSDFTDMFSSYRTKFGGHGKSVVLTFVFAPQAAKMLGATPDGRVANQNVAHGVTPHSSSMKCGITAAINSCGKLRFDKFSGGATTMWDFDPSFVTEDLLKALLTTFFEKGGQIFQGNTTSVEELLEAQKHPENYEHLMVRVGGYSARFTRLSPEVQGDIITRMRHTR
jgi:formate C-acetyltransferase